MAQLTLAALPNRGEPYSSIPPAAAIQLSDPSTLVAHCPGPACICALYGTTTGGYASFYGMYGGTVFEAGVETPLYTFTGGPDGGQPMGGLIGDNQGNLYGTTVAGGDGSFGLGHGVIFKLNIASGMETVLHTFTGPDGAAPAAALAWDSQHNMYGTTTLGGANGYGTVFKLDSSGNFTTLYSFDRRLGCRSRRLRNALRHFSRDDVGQALGEHIASPWLVGPGGYPGW